MNAQADSLLAEAEGNLRVLMTAARSYRDDPEFRTQCESEPQAALAKAGIELDMAGMDVRVRANTEGIFHVVMPADPNSILTDEMMANITGGSTASTAGSTGSGSTVSTPVSSVSSAGTVGSAGSATSS